MVSVHSWRHRGVRTVHRLEAGALALGPESQRAGEGASTVLVVSQSQTDNADDDNDDGDEGDNTTDNANYDGVHVG